MTQLRAAVAHYRRQQQIVTAALARARSYWASGNLRALILMVDQLQQLAAADAARSVPAMLAEQGVQVSSASTVLPSSLAGVASDGRSLVSLFEQALTRRQMSLMVATQLQDASRVAAGVAIATQPAVSGYVRMLNPPSCSRCIVLAGKWFRWNEGFERHPQCDCRHVPVADESMYVELGLVSDPRGYFDSLTAAQQDATFGKAGAQAIRDGADIGQVVNARSGMATASVGGRAVRITTAGTSRRGYFAAVQRDLDRRRGVTGRRTTRPRLMPEQIYAITGDDRDMALRLLASNGYIRWLLAR